MPSRPGDGHGRLQRLPRGTRPLRGPDGASDWVDAPAGVALAHRRLSIIDLSPCTDLDSYIPNDILAREIKRVN